LLHFDDLAGFEHFKAVAPVGEEDHVAGGDDAAFQIVLVIIVEIDSDLARFDEQDFFGELHLAGHGIVNVGGDDVARWPIHVGQLLGEVVGGEELDAFGAVGGSQEHGEGACTVRYGFKHGQIS